MKRVISFVLVLALVLGSFSMAFAAPADVAGTDYEEAVGALTELGVVTGYTDGNYYPEKAVNRAEAAKLVITALGLAEYAEGNTASFTDLAGYGWAAGYIGYAEALGILKGDGNGKFRPADTVSYQEMATMLVRAVGYTDESLPGTWPANYVVKAKALGIMDGIAQAGSAAANRGDVAVMIYNNLDNEIGTVDKDAKWNANEPKDTMLARLDQDLYNLTADIAENSANNTYIDAATTGAGAAFVYDGTQTVADGVNIKAYLGAAVVAYANSDNEITGIKEVKSTFVSGTFSVNDDSQLVLTLEDDTEYNLGSSKGMNAGNTTTVSGVTIQNGIATGVTGVTVGVSTYSAVDDMTLAVKISGNYIKAVYSISNWAAAKVIQWDADYAEELEEDMTLAGSEFAMTQKDEIDTETFAILGAASLEDIKEGNVVTIYEETGDNTITRIEVGTETVKGTVTKVTSDTKYVINGEKYQKTTSVGGSYDVDNGDVALTAEGTFYLDYAGKIAFTDVEVDKADNYGVVIKAMGAAGGYDNDDYKVKLMNAEGITATYTVNEDIVTEVSNAAIAADTVVGFDLNTAGEVSTMVAISWTSTNAGKFTSKNLLDGYKVGNDAVVLVNTSTSGFGGADEEWSVGSVADIPVMADLPNNSVKYYIDAETEEVILVALNGAAVEEDTIYGVIVGYGTIDEDGTDVYEIDILVDGTPDTVKHDDAALDNIGATSLAILDFSGDTLTTITPIATATAVTVLDKTDDGIKTTSASVSYIYDVDAANDQATTTNGRIVDVADDVVVYLYDAEDGFSAAAYKDIKKGNTVYMYQVDTDDENGVDIIVFSK